MSPEACRLRKRVLQNAFTQQFLCRFRDPPASSLKRNSSSHFSLSAPEFSFSSRLPFLYNLLSHFLLNPHLKSLTLPKFPQFIVPEKLRAFGFILSCILPSMGVRLSKDSNAEAAASPIEPNTNSQVNDTDNLSSYVQACQLDPDVQIFDSRLHERTAHVIGSLAGDGDEGFEVRSLSLDSLRQVAGCLIDMNQEVVKVILECKKDIWNNQELFALVQDYFEYSIQTLDFFTALDKCLKRARERQLIIQVALLQFEEQLRNGGDVGGRGKDIYGKLLQELRNFNEAGDPFTEDFFTMFQSVYKQQLQMFEKLQLRKHKLDKKLKQVKAYRKVSNIIFAAAFIAVIICSVVATAISAPPIVSALAAAAASAPMGEIGRWMNSLWKKYENELKTQRKLISTMEVRTYITIKDLDSICVLVAKLEVHIESLLENVEFALTEEGPMTVVIEEIKKQQMEFMEAIDELGEHGNKYSGYIRRARTVILQRIIKHTAED